MESRRWGHLDQKNTLEVAKEGTFFTEEWEILPAGGVVALA